MTTPDMFELNVRLLQERDRLRALIAEALSLIGQGHEPGEYAESMWISGVVNTLKEAEND